MVAGKVIGQTLRCSEYLISYLNYKCSGVALIPRPRILFSLIRRFNGLVAFSSLRHSLLVRAIRHLLASFATFRRNLPLAHAIFRQSTPVAEMTRVSGKITASLSLSLNQIHSVRSHFSSGSILCHTNAAIFQFTFAIIVYIFFHHNFTEYHIMYEQHIFNKWAIHNFI